MADNLAQSRYFSKRVLGSIVYIFAKMTRRTYCSSNNIVCYSLSFLICSPCYLESSIVWYSIYSPCYLESSIVRYSICSPCYLESSIVRYSIFSSCYLESSILEYSICSPCYLLSSIVGYSMCSPCYLESSIVGYSIYSPCYLLSSIVRYSICSPCYLLSRRTPVYYTYIAAHRITFLAKSKPFSILIPYILILWRKFLHTMTHGRNTLLIAAYYSIVIKQYH